MGTPHLRWRDKHQSSRERRVLTKLDLDDLGRKLMGGGSVVGEEDEDEDEWDELRC